MNTIMRILLVWGVADGIWLSVKPKSWAKTWGRVIEAIGGDSLLGRLAGGLETFLCLWLIKKLSCRKK